MDIAPALLALVAGAMLAVQAAVNASLARVVGSPVLATAISFTVGMVALRLPLPTRAVMQAAPAWLWVAGGLLGAVYLSAGVFLAPRLGVAALVSLVIAGQLAAAVVLDGWGAFGLPLRAATPGRLAGIAVTLAGAVMVRLL